MTTEGFQDVKSVRSILYYFFKGCIFRLGKTDLILQLYNDAKNNIIFLFFKGQICTCMSDIHMSSKVAILFCSSYFCIIFELFFRVFKHSFK